MNGKYSSVNKRRGTLMILLMVGMIVMGIIATRLLPEEEIKVRREKENRLQVNLSQIREAFDLKRTADPTYDPDLSNKALIIAALTQLKNDGYLNEDDISDPTIPHYLWGLNDEYFWRSSKNLATNTSFEVNDGSIDGWKPSADTKLSSDTNYLDKNEFDDFPGQNKFGNFFQADGYSIKIVK